uniref:S-protein homolog n=1 Tax=Cicer arietinum TaxID=3827 RepID=A0A1S2Y4P7_CICAR|nr:S-protein homolog 5-like [Cicer arietinum]
MAKERYEEGLYYDGSMVNILESNPTPLKIKDYPISKKSLIEGAMALFIQKILLICALTLLFEHSVLGITVSITNKLQSRKDLTVHCKSADDDLGVRVLKFNHGFDWSFEYNVFGRTQFYCSFKWNGGELKWYDIFIQRRDHCDNCMWSIFEDYPCILRKNGLACFNYNK